MGDIAKTIAGLRALHEEALDNGEVNTWVPTDALLDLLDAADAFEACAGDDEAALSETMPPRQTVTIDRSFGSSLHRSINGSSRLAFRAS